jgi:DNA gyrase subunit A
MGKRTDMKEFKLQKRGGKGVKCYNITEKTGYLIGVKAVTDEHEIMMINTEGIIIQMRASDFKKIGRITSGVKMMNLSEDARVVQIAKVRGAVEDEAETEDVKEEGAEVQEDAPADISEDTSLDRLLDAAEKDSEEE